MQWDVEIDAIGLLCPLPVLKARKRLLQMEQGQVLRLQASDPASILDVPHFCNQTGNLLLGSAEVAALPKPIWTFFIRKT